MCKVVPTTGLVCIPLNFQRITRLLELPDLVGEFGDWTKTRKCERDTADTCQNDDPQFRFEKRNTHEHIWNKSKSVSGCWCNTGFEEKCFKKACKCSTCNDGPKYEARCYGIEDDHDVVTEGLIVTENQDSEFSGSGPDSESSGSGPP